MNQEEYFEARLDNQIDWYDRKSGWNQRWYKRLQVLLIVASATIPFLSGYVPDGPDISSIKIMIGLLGLIVAAIAAILGLYNFQENWIKYRATCESLKKEKFKFLTQVSPYDDDNAFALLVEHVEDLISKENTDWSQQLQIAKDRANA